MPVERIVSTKLDETSQSEQEIENTLRPKTFTDYIGQERLKNNLKLAIKAAKKRQEPVDHILLYGPPGLGKTTMATVIAHEMSANIRITAGSAIERAGDLASLLTNLNDGDILFIDEIHRLGRTVEEVLYSAMEDFKLDIMIGKGPAARSVRLDLPKFTVIGATTRAGSLTAPLRDRFGIINRLEFYSTEEISRIILRASKILGSQIQLESAQILSTRARLTPRVANRLLKRVRDYADINGDGIIDAKNTLQALELLEIDELGLDAGDRNLLSSILDNYGDRPIGLNTIAALTGDETATIEDFFEPYLLQIGFIERTPRGRRVTLKAQEHLKKVVSKESQQIKLV